MFFPFFRLAIVLWAGFALADPYVLGQYAQGGVIFFLTPDMGHGLVAAIADQDSGTGAKWGDDTVFVNSGLDGIFFGEGYSTTAGSLNTHEILSVLGTGGEAATLCKEYSVTIGGETFNDWYLPALAELRLMLKRRALIEMTAVENGGSVFEPLNYWSSVENINSASTAKTLSFDPTEPYTNDKEKTFVAKVRPIRAF